MDETSTRLKKAEKILEERNRAFRILYDTVMDVVRATDDEALGILGRNLRALAGAVFVAVFAPSEGEGCALRLEIRDGTPGKKLACCAEGECVGAVMGEAAARRLREEHVVEGWVDGFDLCDSDGPRALEEDSAGVVTIACVRDDRILAVALLELASGERLRLRDMVDTFVDFAGMIVNRARVQAALRESEHRARVLWENARAGIVLVDPERKAILEANEIAVSILGGKGENRRERVIGAACDTFSSDGAHGVCYDDSLPEDEQENVELELLDLDGNRHSVLQTISRTTVGGREMVIKSFVDITDRKLVERQLMHSQKMEAIGRLAGGIAHDINNVMAAILGSTRALETEKGLSEDAIMDLENIVTACRRGADLTKNLLGFARKGRYLREAFSLNDVAERVASLFSSSASPRHDFRLLLDVALKPIEGDFSQVEHAVMNVCMNAMDAMKGGGTLTITTSNARASRTGFGADGVEYVMMTLGDTGEGMDGETRRRAFEPFFTTKREADGSGLGLAMVYGVVKAHGGEVIIDSVPGEGTTVSMLFPAVQGKTAKACQSDAPDDTRTMPAPKVGSRVLLVDDEVTMLNAMGRLLKKMGLTVFRAGGGEEALAVLEREGGAMDLVILDMIMPGMDGVATFHALRRRVPDLKILLCSAYSLKEDVQTLIDEGARGFLRKPFDFEALSSAVSEAIAANQPS